MTAALRNDLARLVGERALVPEDAQGGYEVGERYGSGRAARVVRPADVGEVSAVVGYCVRHGVTLVPQGANSGLVGASTPDGSGTQVVLGLDRLAAIEAVDRFDRSVVAGAGARLSALNAHAEPHGLGFPIDLGADPSIGGMIATNTGGARLIRYGDVQANLLGLEAVIADESGSVFRDMAGLRKDNSGLDLKQMFVGTGGAFGIVTRAKLQLHALPRQRATALVVPTATQAIPRIIAALEGAAGEFLAACEGMSREAIEAALGHGSGVRSPFPGPPPDYALLVELTSSLACDQLSLERLLQEVLGGMLDGAPPLVADALFGSPADLWRLRHSISEGVRRLGRVIALDIAVPRAALFDFRERARAALARSHPFVRVCDFGHCGDGGLHFNLVWPDDAPEPCTDAQMAALRDLVHAMAVEDFGGSFSAEHGLGPYNFGSYLRFEPPLSRELTSRIRTVFDPTRILGRLAF